MTPEVNEAIAELKATFAEHDIVIEPEEQGGAHVIIQDVNMGQVFDPSITWIGFLIDFQYPRSDIYPHFIDGGIQRADKQPLGEGFSGPKNWQGRSAIQVSRRSNHRNATVDTAALKLMKIIEWLSTR